MKGEVRQKHTSPHITHSHQRNLFTAPSAGRLPHLGRVTTEYGVNGDLIGAFGTKICLNLRVTPGNNLSFHGRGGRVLASAEGERPYNGSSRTRRITTKTATGDRYGFATGRLGDGHLRDDADHRGIAGNIRLDR